LNERKDYENICRRIGLEWKKIGLSNLTRKREEITISFLEKLSAAKIVEDVAARIKRVAARNILGGTFIDFFKRNAQIKKKRTVIETKMSVMVIAPGL